MTMVTKINGWRVTTTDGSVIPVNVRTQDGDYWASIPGCVGACKQTPLIAVACATSPMLDVAEILAPGVPTRDEALDEVERLRRDCEVTADELAEERTRNISLEGQCNALRERAEKDEAALRVVALWLGGPHHPSQPSEVEDIARRVGAEAERLRAGLRRALTRLGVQDCGDDLVEALSSCLDDSDAREREAQEEHRTLAMRHAEACAIIEGRTTPPTREECDAHVARGGWWRGDTVDGAWDVAVCAHYSDLCAFLRDAATEGVTLRWWAHDRTSRPCAWPTVTP